MKIGLWNIDHPEYVHRGGKRRQRFQAVTKYLIQQQCDIYILTEANAAIELTGYQMLQSAESPFHNQRRCYAPPNRYHQVGIYSRLPLSPIEIEEPVNALQCTTLWHEQPLTIYGNVVTMKDQWKRDSSKRYVDRLSEQLIAFDRLAASRTIVAGDFNCRIGLRNYAHQGVAKFAQRKGWTWPTKHCTDTVQHVLHTADLSMDVNLDTSVQHDRGSKNRLSDHPFVSIVLRAK